MQIQVKSLWYKVTNPYFMFHILLKVTWYLARNLPNKYQGYFCECVQPMRDNVTLQYRLSLAGLIDKTIPEYIKETESTQNKVQKIIDLCAHWWPNIKQSSAGTVLTTKLVISLSHALCLSMISSKFSLIRWYYLRIPKKILQTIITAPLSDNPSVAETEIIRENLSLSLLKNNLGESVNIMVEDALLPCIIRSSANMQGTCVLVFDKEGFQQHAPSQSAELISDNDNNNNDNNDNNNDNNINNKCINE